MNRREKWEPPPKNSEPRPKPPLRKAPKVAIISAAAFGLICNQPGTELFFLSLRKAPSGEVASYNNAGVAQEEDVDLSSIPEEYHEFIDLFSKEKADQLPPDRPDAQKQTTIWKGAVIVTGRR